jgi:hypothetical protein
LIRGEATPNYANLSRPEIQDVLTLCPDVKVLFLVREPVDRILSRIAKTFGRDDRLPFSRMTDRHWEMAMEIAQARSQMYQTALSNWPDAVGPTRFRAFNYDQLRDDPEAFMKSIASFLCVDPQFYDGDGLLARRHNSTQRFRDTSVPAQVLIELDQIMREETLFLESNGFRFRRIEARK